MENEGENTARVCEGWKCPECEGFIDEDDLYVGRGYKCVSCNLWFPRGALLTREQRYECFGCYELYKSWKESEACYENDMKCGEGDDRTTTEPDFHADAVSQAV